MNLSSLIENVDSQIIKIRTKSLDVSFNELFDMYKNNELTISPDYQRLFRWGEEKQSRFVESLILEMPVPPIFVIEKEEGVYELIDGLQRISSYLHFRGEKIGDSTDDFLQLQGCDIVNDLNGLTFEELPKALQIKIKRSFVRMEVIKKESETSLKYHMFKRLNTGGELLSAQEIRNCTIRLLGSKGIDFLESCCNNEDYKIVIGKLGYDKIKMRYDQELILRFFAIKNDIDNYRYPVTEYLTRYLEKITMDEVHFEYDKEKEIFERTFKFIREYWNEEAFSSKTISGNMKNDFVLYYFDGLTIPFADKIEEIEKFDEKEKIVSKVNEIKFGEELQAYKTGNPTSIKARIKIFSEGVQSVLECR